MPFYHILRKSLYRRKIVRTVCVETEVIPAIDIAVRYPSKPFDIIGEQGAYEPILSNTLYTQCDEETVFYDIGSDFGYYSQIAQKAGTSPENIYAFEMNEDHAKMFAEANSGDVNLEIRVIGDGTDGESIDDYVQTHESPSIVKIDVEGKEYEVLKGMENTLEKENPLVFVEIHPKNLHSGNRGVSEVLELLHEAGYTLFAANHRKSDAEWSEIKPSEPYHDIDGDWSETDTRETTYMVKAV